MERSNNNIRLFIRKEVENILSENFEFEDSQKQKTFKPTPGMKKNAKNALEAISKNDLTSTGGNEGSGKTKAKNIIDNQDISFSMLKRMKAFYDNNYNQYQQEKNSGKTIENSGLIQTWNLWGGDEGRSFVNSNINDENKTNLNRKKNRRLMSTTGSGNVTRLVDTNYHRKK